MPLALLLIVLAAGWRVLAVLAPDLGNFAPLMALTFCGAVYFQDKKMWLVPFVGPTLSDLYLHHFFSPTFHETWTWPSVAVRLVCFALALPIGRLVAQHKNWLTLFSGALGGAVFFYF